MDSTTDEPIHIQWNERIVYEAETERESNYFFNSKTPVLIPNIIFRDIVGAFADLDKKGEKFVQRLPTIFWFLGTLLLTFLISRKIASKEASLLAVSIVALDPNLIAHSSLATVDAAFAFGVTFFVWAAINHSNKNTLISAAVLGLALGLAFSAKFSGAILALSLPLILLLGKPKSNLLNLSGNVLILGLSTIATINFAYLFNGSFEVPNPENFQTSLFKSLSQHLGFALSLVPLDFWTGLDRCLYDDETRVWAISILGEFHNKPIWYYFLFLWFVKTPFIVVGTSLTSLFYLLRSKKLWQVKEIRYIFSLLVFCLLYFSLIFKTQIGYRYTLFIVPLVACLIASALRPWAMKPAVSMLALSAIILELGLFTGNPISFTNSFILPKRSAYKYISDSNIDWRQNYHSIKKARSRPDLQNSIVDPIHILPGTNLIRHNVLTGVWSQRFSYEWLRNKREPREHINHTHLVYDISDKDFDQFLEESRSPESIEFDRARCLVTYKTSEISDKKLRLPKASNATFGGNTCFEVDKSTVIKFSTQFRSLHFGVRNKNDQCLYEEVPAGKEIWYKLKPGFHSFCLYTKNNSFGVLELDAR